MITSRLVSRIPLGPGNSIKTKYVSLDEERNTRTESDGQSPAAVNTGRTPASPDPEFFERVLKPE